MTNLIKKFWILGLFFLLIPIFLEAGTSFNVNLGPQVYKDSEIPVILSRATWENTANLGNLLDWYPSSIGAAEDEDEENKPPDYSSVDRIVIHDMGCDVRHPGCNNKKLNPLTTIQNIYRYHAVTRGWGDIGYHYIIDYWGNIYEGRYGGNGVRGAHTYYDRKCDNFNVGSVSVLLMGNYESVELSEQMYKSLIRLVAWIAATNGLDPAESSHTSEIWHSLRNGSGCDLSQGGLTSTYTGPVVVGHGDVEEGNSDPGLVNLKRVRQEAGKFLLAYKNYFYTIKGDLEVYSIKDGFASLVKPSSSKEVVVLNKNQFYAFSSTLDKVYPDGTLVKSDTRNRVYLIGKNKRRPILSERLFNLRKFKWSDVKFLSDRDLAKYSLDKPLTYPDGVLVKAEGPEVYLIENDKRRHISSAILFNRMSLKWKDIIQISQAELLAHPLGEKFLLTDGVLIKEEKLPAVYLLKNQKRHWIKTLQAFLSLNYKWENVVSLSSREISHYAVGSAISATGDLSKLEEAEEPAQSSSDIQASPPECETCGRELNIRVGIYEVPVGASIKIKAKGPYEVYKNDILLANKKANESIAIPYSKTDFYKFEPSNENAIFEIISYQDRPKWNPRINDNHFRGTLEIKYSLKSKKLWIINELPLEDYLKGVAEALNDDPIEYLKTFVVAARSYALFHVQNKGKRPGEIFHLRNWAFDQLYKGYGFEKRASNISRAVEETKGVTATYNDKPIRGVYSSDSGGVTKSACKVFKGEFCDNEDYNYLKGGVKDPEGAIHDRAAIIASHGVGMSSAGARRLAETGKNFEEILKYYYLGVEVEKAY